tara:strand:+ start:836 stop:1177 length:342 start_codon:yes stop_codon:yes gene_type:complete
MKKNEMITRLQKREAFNWMTYKEAQLAEAMAEDNGLSKLNSEYNKITTWTRANWLEAHAILEELNIEQDHNLPNSIKAALYIRKRHALEKQKDMPGFEGTKEALDDLIVLHKS